VVVLGKAFQPGEEPTTEWSTWKVLHPGGLQPYSQTLDKTGKACNGQIFWLIMNIIIN